MGKIVLLTKRDAWCENAGLFAQIVFGDQLSWIRGTVGDPFPEDAFDQKLDYLISYLSPWIVPGRILDTSSVSVNFHPASRDYPGTGCYNFCLYEGAAEYGAICHHMVQKVDRGAIIEERRFPVLSGETVETLKYRTMIVMLALYHDILSGVAAGRPLPSSAGGWSRVPFTRAQLEELCVITPAMTPDEINRRIRATVYPGRPGPKLLLGETAFAYDVPKREPLA